VFINTGKNLRNLPRTHEPVVVPHTPVDPHVVEGAVGDPTKPWLHVALQTVPT